MAELRVLIADDEPLVRRDLRRVLSSQSDVTLVGEARDGGEALERIEALAPDVVFLDIRMPELDGFAVVAALEDVQPAIVFVTAFDTYAVRAFDIHAVDYLLKPFDPPRLLEALERARGRVAAGVRTVDVEALAEWRASSAAPVQRLAVRTRGRIRYLAVEEVDRIEAADNYVLLHTREGRFPLRSTLRAVERVLDGRRFARTHRSHIVRLACVAEVEPLFKGDAIIVLKTGDRVPLSRTYRDSFRTRMRASPS